MLSSLLRNGFSADALIMVLCSIPIIILALCVHESAHGLAAKWMGDPTAYNLGRISLNPIKHLDPIGAILMFVFGFGWAKPVPINTRYFRNPKWGMAISALAGPLSNVFCSYIFFLGTTLIERFAVPTSQLSATVWTALLIFCVVGYTLNLSLAVFNLIPLPPLDGSRVLNLFLSNEAYFKIMQYERYVSLLLMAALYMGVLDTPMYIVRSFLLDGMNFLTGFIDIIAKTLIGA